MIKLTWNKPTLTATIIMKLQIFNQKQLECREEWTQKDPNLLLLSLDRFSEDARS